MCVYVYMCICVYACFWHVDPPSATARFRWLRLARGILCRHPPGISSCSLRSATNWSWPCSATQLPLVTTTSSSTVDIVSTANDLGVILDGQLTMAWHDSSVCRAGFFQLRQLRSIRRSLTTEATRALVQAFISCRLDYCNSLLPGSLMFIFGDSSLCRTPTARLVSGAHRNDHITPVLVGLHWLPVRQRIIYKTACTMQPLAIWLTCVCRPGAPAGFQARVGKIRREAPKKNFRLPTLVFSLLPCHT